MHVLITLMRYALTNTEEILNFQCTVAPFCQLLDKSYQNYSTVAYYYTDTLKNVFENIVGKWGKSGKGLIIHKVCSLNLNLHCLPMCY